MSKIMDSISLTKPCGCYYDKSILIPQIATSIHYLYSRITGTEPSPSYFSFAFFYEECIKYNCYVRRSKHNFFYCTNKKIHKVKGRYLFKLECKNDMLTITYIDESKKGDKNA